MIDPKPAEPAPSAALAEPRIDYSRLHAYAEKAHVSYNELCSAVREAVREIVAPIVGEPPTEFDEYVEEISATLPVPYRDTVRQAMRNAHTAGYNERVDEASQPAPPQTPEPVAWMTDRLIRVGKPERGRSLHFTEQEARAFIEDDDPRGQSRAYPLYATPEQTFSSISTM